MRASFNSGSRNIILLTVVGFLLLVIISMAVFQNQKKNIRILQERELKVIADYKTNEILNWKNNYLRSAEEIVYEDKIRQYVSEIKADKKAINKQHAEFEYYLKELSEEYSFSRVFICDTDGELLTPGFNASEKPDSILASVCKNKTFAIYPGLSEFHRDSLGKIHLTLIVPVFNYTGLEKTLIGYFFGIIYPDEKLYPIIQSWPFESETSETMLAEERGDSIIILNELRHLSGSALNLTLSKRDTTLVSIKAYSGSDRIEEGTDYRGKEVVSYLKRIPGTDWALIVKTDNAELMKSVWYRFANIASIAFLSLSGILLGFVFVVKQEKKRMYQSLYEKELEKNTLLKEYDYLIQNAGDIIFLIDGNGQIVDANQKALREYGYKPEEIIGHQIEKLRGNGGFPNVREIMRNLHDIDGLVFETKHVKSNGEVFPVEISAKLITLDGEHFYQSIVRDISERKTNEIKINRLNRLYSMLSASNKAIVRKTNADELFEELIRVALHLGKFTGVWIGKVSENRPIETLRQEKFSNGNAQLVSILLMNKIDQLLLCFSGRPVYYCNSIKASELLTEEEKQHITAESFAAMKLENPNGEIIFAIFLSDKTDFFAEEDKLLLDEMAEDLAFGLRYFNIEQSFKTSEARFKTVVEEFPAGVFILDAAGRMTYNNRIVQEITGLDSESLSGYKWLRGLQREDKQQLIRRWISALSGGENFEAGGNLLRQNDQQIFWKAKTAPIFSGEEIIGHAGMIFDESEVIKKQFEINKLFAAVSQTASAIVITDTESRIEYVNPAFEKMTGYTAEEAIGRNPHFLKSGLTSAETFTEMYKHLTAGEPWRGEFINRKKGGDIYYESAVVTPVMDPFGKIVNYLAVKDDITQVREYQSTIENQVRLLEDVLELLPVGVWIVDAEGVILRGNTTAKKIWSGAKYVGIEEYGEYKARWYKTGEEILPHEWAAARAIANRETSINEEVEIDCFDGTRKIIFNSAVPIISANGELTGAIIVNEDITRIKQSEKELIESKERAEESNRLKGNFLANMSHELRTPMIGVLGYSEIIYDGGFEEEVVEYARLIHKSGKRLLDTLNLILDLSRLEAGKLDLRKDNVDLVKTTIDVIQNFRGAAERNGLYINLETDFLYMNIHSDERLLTSILDNLVNNAVKYTHTGGVTVSISSADESESGKRMIKISVADTGIGIAKENHEMIFEEFRQVSEGTDRGYEGTGLGLSITKKFLEKLNGAITLESEAGCGSVFHVSFPAEVIEELKKEKSERVEKPTIKDEASSKKSILLVENDELNVTIIKKYLYEKYLVEHVWNGEAAVKIAGEKKFDAVLMDINLGKGLDGLAATKWIRSCPLNSETPVIAMTAYAMPQDRATFLEGGCSHYLSKPFRQIELLRLLEDVLAGKAGEMI